MDRGGVLIFSTEAQLKMCNKNRLICDWISESCAWRTCGLWSKAVPSCPRTPPLGCNHEAVFSLEGGPGCKISLAGRVKANRTPKFHATGTVSVSTVLRKSKILQSSSLQSHRTTAWLRLEGSSGGHLVQPRAGCPGPRPAGFWRSPNWWVLIKFI